MLYLLDANVLIDANRDYYPISRIPEFWDWLVDRALKLLTKIPLEMYEEILNPDYSSRKHKMSKRARHVESNQRVTGYPQKTAGTRPG